MTDHVHYWMVSTVKGHVVAICNALFDDEANCDAELTPTQIDDMLNAAERLKPALEDAFATYPYEDESGIKKITLGAFARIQGLRIDAGWRK